MRAQIIEITSDIDLLREFVFNEYFSADTGEPYDEGSKCMESKIN
jgi:hypothetical protein